MQSNTKMANDNLDFVQGDIVWAQYPLTDKIDKLKLRPVLIIGNDRSDSLDNDCIAIPITKTIRQQPFSITVQPVDVDGDLPVASELRCNKPFTVRRTLLYDKIGVLSEAKTKHAIQLAIEAIEYRPKLRRVSVIRAQL